MENANTVVTLLCRDCGKSVYIENVEVAEVKFCPRCGGTNISVVKSGVSYQ